MEKSSKKQTLMSKIFTSQSNWRRLVMLGVPLLLFAVLAMSGVFTTYAHAAAPDNVSKSSMPSPKDETVTGTLTKIDLKSNTLIVRNFNGHGQTTVHVNHSTRFVSKGMGRKGSLRDLKVGDFITAIGPRNKDRERSIEAKQIVVSKAPRRS